MSRLSKYRIGKEFARRKVKFHSTEDWRTIKCFGLFSWGAVSRLLGKELYAPGYSKENKIIWCVPSEEFYNKWVVPRIEEIEKGVTK